MSPDLVHPEKLGLLDHARDAVLYPKNGFEIAVAKP
jgi:hypothetical protein